MKHKLKPYRTDNVRAWGLRQCERERDRIRGEKCHKVLPWVIFPVIYYEIWERSWIFMLDWLSLWWRRWWWWWRWLKHKEQKLEVYPYENRFEFFRHDSFMVCLFFPTHKKTLFPLWTKAKKLFKQKKL